MFNFKPAKLKKRLGKGNFGEVFAYQKNEDDFQWAVKRIDIEMKEAINSKGGIDSERTCQNVLSNILKWLPEIVIGFSIDHPCVVPIKGYFIEKANNGFNLYMKLPRMKMSLEDEFKGRELGQIHYEEAQLVKYFYCLASGVEYLHSKKIFHRDIKINNILLDDQGIAKLSDVGTAKYVADEDFYNMLTGDQGGAINYKAPELIKYEEELKKNEKDRDPNFVNILLKKDSLFALDSWSFGLTMLELCTLKKRPVNPFKNIQEISKDLEKIRENIQEKKLYQNSLVDMIFGLMNINPQERLKVSDIKLKLEEQFQDIITEEYKASIGILRDNSKEDEERKAASQRIEEGFEKKISDLKMEIIELENKLKFEITRKNREIEEMNKKYEDVLQKYQTEKEEWAQKIHVKYLEKSLEKAVLLAENSENKEIQQSKENQKLLDSIKFSPFYKEENLNRGLRNLGETGYFNSFLQCWYHVEPFRKTVLEYNERNHLTPPLFEKLQMFFYHMKFDSDYLDSAHETLLNELFSRREEFSVNKKGDSSILFQAFIEELSCGKEPQDVPYLKMFFGGTLMKKRRCQNQNCRGEKLMRESIKMLEVRDSDFIKDRMDNYFQPSFDVRTCPCSSDQTIFECFYSVTHLPEILVIRIHDTKDNPERVQLLEEITFRETLKGNSGRVNIIKYRFIAGVFNLYKGENGSHSVEISKHNNKYYEFSDLSIRSSSPPEYITKHPKVLYYQRI